MRTDRIGDVLLTTPVSSALRARFPAARIAWLVAPYTAPLLEHNPDVDAVLVDEGGSAAALARRLRAERFDAALVVHPRWRVVQAVWRARIRVRIGPASKVYALLLSHPIRQRRSRVRRHEADYNLELLAPLGVPFRRFPTRLVLTAEERERGRAAAARLAGDSPARPLVILHPGGGGSAARWPAAHFRELAARLHRGGAAVAVTAGPGETHAPELGAAGGDGGDGGDAPAILPPGGLSLRELAALLAAARLVVAGSTGPLHMAVALGVPTVSIFPGAGTAQPRRWGPYPAFPEGDPTHVVLAAPAGADGEPAMAQVSVDGVFNACRRQLQGAP